MAGPALRLQGLYLALATMAFARMAEFLFFAQPDVFGTADRQIPDLSLFGWKVGEPFELIGITFPQDAGILLFITVLFCIVGMAVVWTRQRSLGRRLIAMRDSPSACATVGVNLTMTKLIVFVLSAAVAGLAGGLFAYFYGSIGTTSFPLTGGARPVAAARRRRRGHRLRCGVRRHHAQRVHVGRRGVPRQHIPRLAAAHRSRPGRHRHRPQPRRRRRRDRQQHAPQEEGGAERSFRGERTTAGPGWGRAAAAARPAPPPGGTGDGGARRERALRWVTGRARRRPAVDRGFDHGVDRPERCRQDDAVQRRHRLAGAGRRQGVPRRRRRHRRASAQARPAGHRAHVPTPRDLRLTLGPGQRARCRRDASPRVEGPRR